MPDEPPAAPPSPDFHLDSSVPDSREGAAAFYRVDPKTISRWKTMGAKSSDPCPWKTPSLMPGWWQRVSRKPVPACLQRAADLPRPAGSPLPGLPFALSPFPPPAPEAPGDLPRLPGFNLSEFSSADYEFDEMRQGMVSLMRAQRKLLDDACATGDNRLINQLTDKYSATVEAMRRLDKDSGKIQLHQGTALRSSDVRAAILEAHQFIPARCKAVLKRRARAFLALLGFVVPEKQIDEWADDTIHEAFATLVNTDLLTTPKAA